MTLSARLGLIRSSLTKDKYEPYAGNIDADITFLLTLVAEYERALRIAVSMVPDETSSSEMWNAQEAASDALKRAERLAGEEG